MDEIDVGVGLQEIAPHALAGMRLAGDQQHAQLVAHAVDGDDGLVVDRGQLARQRRHFELEDVLAGVVDRDRDVEPLADAGVVARERLAVALDRDRRRLAVVVAVEHAHADGLALADDAEARRLDQFEPPVALALVAGDERVQRRVEAERVDLGGDVVDDAVGDEDGAADALGRHVGERVAQRANSSVPLLSASSRGLSMKCGLDIAHRGELLDDRGARGLGLRGALADAVGAGAVDDDGDDVLQRPPVLALQRGIGEREQQQRGDGGAHEAPRAGASRRSARRRATAASAERAIEPQRQATARG